MTWKKNMQPLDFSCFEGILIEDEEGNIQPMSEPYFKAKELAPGIWQVLSDGDYSYVIEGDEETIVIDAGLGAGNIREFCQTLTDKPIYRVFNTHSHFDHTCNNYLFDAVYMSKKSYENRCVPFGEYAESGLQFPADYPVVFIEDGDVIDLGSRKLEVFNIEEHCIGSLSFLDRKSRILFCGDELNGNFFDSQISVEHSFRNVCRWMSFRDAYDTLCAGNGIYDAVFVDRYYKSLKYILEGHESEGKELFVPYEDPIASSTEKDGKPLYRRRPPHMDKLFPPELLIQLGFEEALKMNHGRTCFCFARKLNENAMFDRQLEMNDCRVCYYINRIWDK